MAATCCGSGGGSRSCAVLTNCRTVGSAERPSGNWETTNKPPPAFAAHLEGRPLAAQHGHAGQGEAAVLAPPAPRLPAEAVPGRHGAAGQQAVARHAVRAQQRGQGCLEAGRQGGWGEGVCVCVWSRAGHAGTPGRRQASPEGPRPQKRPPGRLLPWLPPRLHGVHGVRRAVQAQPHPVDEQPVVEGRQGEGDDSDDGGRAHRLLHSGTAQRYSTRGSTRAAAGRGWGRLLRSARAEAPQPAGRRTAGSSGMQGKACGPSRAAVRGAARLGHEVALQRLKHAGEPEGGDGPAQGRAAGRPAQRSRKPCAANRLPVSSSCCLGCAANGSAPGTRAGQA